MAEMLKHRDMEKYYLCIVKGKIEGSQKVSAYLKKDEKTNKVKVSKQEIAGASHIETAYEPVISNDEFYTIESQTDHRKDPSDPSASCKYWTSVDRRF